MEKLSKKENPIQTRIIWLLKRIKTPLSIYEIADELKIPVSTIRYHCVGIDEHGGGLLKNGIIKLEYVGTKARGNHFAQITLLNDPFPEAGVSKTPASPLSE